jgi:hypothetical protein
MSKQTTSDVQNWIVALGKKMGFHSEPEAQFPTLQGKYSPRFDVVWYLDVPPNVLLSELDLFPNNDWNSYFKRIPIASFEIEGSTTTSKNQVGNFANLYMSPTLINFVVVLNSEASNENDTYRRGVKISRTFRHLYGDKNVILVDWSQLYNVNPIGLTRTIFNDIKEYSPRNKGSGGEKDSSIAIINSIGKKLSCSSLFVFNDYKPHQLQWAYSQIETLQRIQCPIDCDIICGKTATWDPSTKDQKSITRSQDWYYIPKLDIIAGFYLPEIFTSFLYCLSHQCEPDSCIYPLLNYIKSNYNEQLFFPFISVEVESGISKHLNGGILNMSAFSFMGLLVSSFEGQRHLQMIQEQLSVRNVFFKDIQSIKYL